MMRIDNAAGQAGSQGGKPALMRGSDWSGQDLAGWWISEKLDGWRAYWDGSQFISRQGRVYEAPAWFRSGMPARALDGELWAGPGTTHDDVNAAVLAGNWQRLVFRPFDVPELSLKIEAAQGIISGLDLPPHCQPVAYRRVASTAEAIGFMHSVVAAGGEGAMARKPGAGYAANCRTQKLLKLKPDFVPVSYAISA
jgi:DNA ligase-1